MTVIAPISNIISLQNNFHIAFLQRLSNSDKTIVFIHGFGSAKEHFRCAFDSPSLEEYTLIAVDLAGFGQSRGPDDFGYSMKEQAEIVIELLAKMDAGNIHLCAHSMGGLVAMNMAELEPHRVLSFIDLEGNLTPEDCFFSGKITEKSFEQFAERGKRKFTEHFRNAGKEDSSMSEYAATFSSASTVALYKSAHHTVEDSSTPLVERFLRIKNACYIYGEKNRGVFPGEKLLTEAKVPIFYITDAGHSMATENPVELYRVIKEFLDGLKFP